MYIKRNAQQQIVAVSQVPTAGFDEAWVELGGGSEGEELARFLDGLKAPQQLTLEQSDLAMARVLEDVIQLLVTQGTIRFTDLPNAAQTKLLSRRELRGQMQGVNLLDDSDGLSL